MEIEYELLKCIKREKLILSMECIVQKTDLIVNDNIVFGRHVIGNVVIHNETQKPVQQCQVNLLIHLLVARLQHDVTFTLCCLPHILQVVDS